MTVKDFSPTSSFFIPEGKVENFGTFPGSDFPPQKFFWENLSIWGIGAFNGRAPGSWHQGSLRDRVHGNLAHHGGVSEQRLGLYLLMLHL